MFTVNIINLRIDVYKRQGMGYKDAIKKLKKKAAKLGAGVILVADRTNETAAALGGKENVFLLIYKCLL